MRWISPVMILLGSIVFGSGIAWLIVSRQLGGGVFDAIIASLVMGIGALIYRFGRRLRQPTAHQVLAADPRDPILLIRSFARDRWPVTVIETNPLLAGFKLLNPLTFTPRTLEEHLMPLLKELGPIIAFGEPHEKLPPLGAARTYSREDNWKDEFSRVIEKASLIVVILGETASLRWELEQIIASGFLSKTLIIFPSEINSEKYQMISSCLRRVPGMHEHEQSTVAATFPPEGTIKFKTKRRVLPGTVRAVEEAISELRNRIRFESMYTEMIRETGEEIQCLSCGGSIPSGANNCTNCGWTYR